MTFIPFVISRDALSIFIGGVPSVVHEDHASYDDIKAGLIAQTFTEDEVRALIKPITKVEELLTGNPITDRVSVGVDSIILDGRPIVKVLSDRMMQFLEAGADLTPWARFVEKLYANPNPVAIEELFLWLEASGMPITVNGNFLAYKKVRDDYGSYYDNGATKNLIGTMISMPREQVDPSRHNTCSRGLHFCSWSYLPNYQGGEGKVLILEINPADVVAIPSDYDNAKGRAWQYIPIGEVPEAETKTYFSASPVYPAPEPEHDDLYTKGFVAGVTVFRQSGNELPDLDIYDGDYAQGVEDGFSLQVTAVVDHHVMDEIRFTVKEREAIEAVEPLFLDDYDRELKEQTEDDDDTSEDLNDYSWVGGPDDNDD